MTTRENLAQLRLLWGELRKALRRTLCIARGGHSFYFSLLRRGEEFHRVLECRRCGVITPYREPMR